LRRNTAKRREKTERLNALYWLELLELEGYFKPAAIALLKQEAAELIAIFVSPLRKR
jgi:hypothetical protein